MDIQSILLGIFLFLIFMLPILYVIISNSNSEKKRLKTIQALCQAQHISIKSPDVIGNTIIGMDDDFKNLIVADRLKINETFQIIPLKELKSCSVKTIRVKNKTLDTVELDLIGNNFVREIVFYKEEDDLNMADGEACLNEASRWEKTIKNKLQLS